MAIGVSQAFKDAMQAPVKVVKATISADNGQTFESSDELISFSMEASGYYFGAVSKALDFSLLGTTYNLLDKDIHVVLSVLTDSTNDTWADCDLGNFRITEQKANLEKETTTFRAYDRVGMLAFDPYMEGGLTFPNTIANVVAEFADNYAFDYTPHTLTNGSYVIPEDLYKNINNITYRDILAEIAGATASIARVDGTSNVLTLQEPLQTTSETWTYANLKSIKFQPKYGEINAVVLSRTPQEDNVVVRDEESIAENGLTELKLANNEILDDNREELAQPILDAVDGFDFYPFEAETEGHGWHECGDRIGVTDGTNFWDIVITYIKLTIDGGMKETIKGIRPADTQTDYALAGGIMKTIYNTEIKVDKQGQEITSVVSRQEQFENETHENFSQVVQNISSITTTIQTTGGGNAIHNSVGYNKDTDGTLVGWTSTGTVASETSPESLANGALSGNQIDLGVSSSITQRIAVDSSGSVYTLSFRAKKSVVGQAKVHLRNSIDDYVVNLPNGTDYLWEQFELVGVKPSESYFDLVVETNGDMDYFAITDLMLTVGDSITPWVQASDEILSKNVALDSNGVKVSSNTSNDYVKLDELGLNGYSDAGGTMENVFTINRDMTEVSKLKARKQIEMPPLKVIPINTDSNSGWAFIKIGDE